MPSLIQGFEYDVFISYRQNDNRSGWVTKFVEDLREELAATLKDPINIYFDENPHDGLLDTHLVDESLKGKLKCLIFVPILSRTYCDPKGFAWDHEFIPFCMMAKEDAFGMVVRLGSGNAASRVLPVTIHDIDQQDKQLFEKQLAGQLRPVDFVFRSSGVNRPLSPEDARSENASKALYRDQINKVANAVEALVSSLRQPEKIIPQLANGIPIAPAEPEVGLPRLWRELQRRSVFRAGLTYIIVGLLLLQIVGLLTPMFKIEQRYIDLVGRAILVGFPLAVLMAWLFEISPDGIVRTNSPISLVNPYPPHKRKPLTSTPLIIALIISLILLAFYFKVIMEPPARKSDAPPVSIAVLPFENLSESKEDGYMAEGITDEIINRLTIIGGLRVTNHSNSRQMAAQLISYDEIARKLDVRVLVKGTVRRAGNEILISAQLIELQGTSSRFVWGNTFHRTSDNLMVAVQEIAKEIAERLKIKLSEMEELRLSIEPTQNFTAYDYFLKGRELYFKYRESANDSAVVQFKLAIGQDKSFARAWSGLADAFSQMRGRFGREKFWTDSAIVAGQIAVSLDSTLSDAYKSLGVAYSYKKHYDKAYPYYRRAVDLNPKNERALGNLGTNALNRGDLPQALSLLKSASGMDPKNWIPYLNVGWTYRLLGQLDDAEQWLNRSLEFNARQPDTYEILGYTLVSQGRKKAALELVPKMLRIDSGSRMFEAAGLIAHFAGDNQNAKAYFQQSIERNPMYKEDNNTFAPVGLGQILLEEGVKVDAEVYLTHAFDIFMEEINLKSQSNDPPFHIAAIYAARGNKQQALTWLQTAINANWVDYAKFNDGPFFRKYRNDPDFLKKVSEVEKRVEAMRKVAQN